MQHAEFPSCLRFSFTRNKLEKSRKPSSSACACVCHDWNETVAILVKVKRMQRNEPPVRSLHRSDGSVAAYVPPAAKCAEGAHRSANLHTQLNLRDRRKLTKEAQLRVKFLYQRFAHYYFRERRWTGTGRTSTCATGISAPSSISARSGEQTWRSANGPYCPAREKDSQCI